MPRFRSIFVGLLFVFLKVWCGASELTFVTWPNETQVVVNETVKFIWKYRAIDTDVTVKWGTSEFISPNVATFKDIFFIAREYEKYRKPIMHDKIPLRYRDRVRIVGQASLQIINVTLEDEGHYLCEITEGSGWKTLSRAATLRVLVPPTIENHPGETILLSEGQQLKIGCKASGRPLPHVSWYRDAVNKEMELTQAVGSSEYIKERVESGDEGNYICIARSNASEDQFTVQVIVQYRPLGTKIKTDAKSDTLRKGEDLKIICETNSKPEPKYWFYHESDTGEKKLVGDDQAITSGVYHVRNVKASDRGNYSCIPNNTVGEGLEAKVGVTVLFPPEIIELNAEKRNLSKGDALKLSCKASGFPKPKIMWTKKGDSSAILGYEEVYEKVQVDENDGGDYVCTATNENLPDARKTINVNVFYKPVIDKEKSSIRVTALIGEKTELRCSAKGNPVPSFEWKKGELGRLGFKSTFVIKALKTTDYGDYKCVVTNALGTTVHNVKVVEVGQPSLTELRAIHVSSRSAHITWKSSANKEFPIKYHVLSYALENEKLTHIRISGEHKHSYKIKDLIPYSKYVVNVKAWNEHIPSNVAEITFQTKMARPGPPSALQLQIVSPTSFRVNWSPPVETNGVLDQYILEYSVSNDTSTSKQVQTRGKETSVVLTDLETSKTYRFRVKAATKSGFGNFSEYVIFPITTPVPSQPIDLNVYVHYDKSISLKWKRPVYSGGKLKKYTVLYRPGTGRWMTKELKSDLKNETITLRIDGIKSGSRYELKVRAIGHQPGLWSETLEYMQGSELFKVNIESHPKKHITITWNKPFNPSVKVTKYTVFYRTKDGRWKSMAVTSGLDNNTLSVKLNGMTGSAIDQIKLQAHSNRKVYLTDELKVVSAIKEARKSDDTDHVPLFGGIIAGILIFAFVIIVVAMFVRYNYRKRQRKRRRAVPSHPTPGVLITQENGLTHISSPSENLSSDSPGSEKYLRPERKGNSVQVPLRLLGGGTKPIPVSNLFEYCKEHRRDGNKGFSEEFKSVDCGVNYSSEESKKAVNKSKNRYNHVVTFDHTRVCLSNLGEPGSDYINANYVDGYNCPEKFIATQGPVSVTFSDFWRMIWEQNCSAIVMVTNLIEKGKVKCQRYWPVTEAELFGSLTVNPIGDWELTDYTIRKFQLQQNNNSELVREVTQFHYTAWPDHGVPTHPTRILAFVRRVRNYFQVSTGKIVVHCSAGVGRSGTFIALDALLDQLKAEGVVDIFGFVSHMRTQRHSMVQTEAQYSFIYEAILEASICGETEIAVPEFAERLKMLQCIDSEDQECLIAKEFEKINTVSIDEKETCVNALMPENREKNRYSSVLPYDSTRVKLWPYPNEKGSDYINASFIDGYRNREIFITTQAPLKRLLEEFWRMIWEYECYVLVMLANLVEDDEIQCSQYWPSQGEEYAVFGLLMIEIESEQELDCYIKRALKCTNTKSGEVRKMYHLHYTGWPDHGVPASAASVLDFIKDILRIETETGNGLTLVHCSDGSGRSGTLITLYIALERLKLESIIDVFGTVRNLRTQRVGMVENLEQYRFCYYALQEYVKSSSYTAKLK